MNQYKVFEYYNRKNKGINLLLPVERMKRRINNKGYVELLLTPDDLYYFMVNVSGLVLEHRYVMAQSLQRPLTRFEVVHHKDRNKQNNSIDNLELLDANTHNIISLQQQRIDQLECEVAILKRRLSGQPE